ncbi:MAG: nucleoside triphosphate pyrophosphatase [Thiobacillaceae bacterium]
MEPTHKLIDKRIYLASQSPRRRELLKQIGVSFEVLPLRTMGGRADVIEMPYPDESPVAFAERMARAKAGSGWSAVVARRLLRFPVMGADTLVDVDGDILCKPQDRSAAEAMLQRLSGRNHWVHTAIAIQQDGKMACLLSSSKVEFGVIELADIQRYLDSGEFSGKAGAYAIQGRASAFVKHIEGSYTGIMGLPLFETTTLLKQFGIVP